MGLEDVQNQFGHSSITLTSNTYGHVLEQRQRQVAMGMDAALGGVVKGARAALRSEPSGMGVVWRGTMRGTRITLLSTLAVLVVTSAVLGASPSPGGTLPVPLASTATMTPTGLLLWPAPPDAMERTIAAGLTPERVESLTYHVHAGLMIFLDGVPVAVPAGIGIDISNAGVQSFPDPEGMGYGGISGCEVPCISPLHTHGWFGVLHTESSTPVPNQLGEFFDEWGVALAPGCVGRFCAPGTSIAIEVDGIPFAGDPRTIELTDHRVITIVIGTPPAVVPTSFDFGRD